MRGGVLGARVVVDIRLTANDTARFTCLEMAADGLERGALTPLEAELHNPAAFLNGVHHRTSLTYVVTQRLLAINIKTMSQGGDELQSVPVGWGGDDDGFEAGCLQKFLVQFKGLRA